MGIFVVFEGPDGSGKSTACQAVYDHYRAQGLRVLHSREPGGTPIGEMIRQILLDPKNKAMGLRTEALLYAASRAQHVEEKIRPFLEEGGLVLSERYVFSSLVYQGMARGLGLEGVQAINDFAIQGVKADLTLYLDPGEASSFHRILDRDLDRLELEGEDFNQGVRAHYMVLAQQKRNEMTFIDATLPKDQVAQACIDAIEEKRREKK
ncbi:MAG: dTMP kinase [Tissierellia bacterium]|nr:dTMP kinase [Tissierellia bacterium]